MSCTDSPRIQPVGTRALLIDLPSLAQVMTWHQALQSSPLPGQRDVIAAARTVLLIFHSPRAASQAASTLRTFDPQPASAQHSKTVQLQVSYRGEDLAEVAKHLGMSTEAVINWHTSQQWQAAFAGFAPGFMYCIGEDADLAIPRKQSPRLTVPSGAVAVAGEFSAVYPRSSPGGWQLIGQVAEPMWDTHRRPPALLAPGDRISYQAVSESVHLTTHPDHTSTAEQPDHTHHTDAGDEKDSAHQKDTGQGASGADTTTPAVLTLVTAGLLSLFQDQGRPGLGDLGVTSSGAADRTSAWVANDVVGNPGHAVVIENIGGMCVRAHAEVVLAITGAVTELQVGARQVSAAHPILLRAGEELVVSPAQRGLRTYLAVRGGFAAAEELGSAATDTLSGLGPAPLEDGAQLSLATAPGELRSAESVALPTVNPVGELGPEVTLRCVPGPRADWFSASELSRFSQVKWQVSGQSNRVGLRLQAPSGAAEIRRAAGELRSEGLVAGCVQVPPNGLPIVFLADHPVTGGYPVIATVIAEDLSRAAQVPPGSVVTFEFVEPAADQPGRADVAQELRQESEQT